MEIDAERITTPDGVGGYLAHPRHRKAPAILVAFEIFGVTSHIEDVCRRLAGAGYVALAPDYFWRLPVKTAPYSDREAAFGMASTLKDEQVMSDAGSAIRYLRSNACKDFVEADAIGTVGFCMGGRISILIAAEHAQFISAAISFYGGGLAGENRRGGQTLDPLQEVAKIQAPILLFYGAKDKFILPEHIEKFTGRLKVLGKKFEHHVYPADHAFFCDERASYDAAAAIDSWKRTLEFLEANLKKTTAVR